MTTMTPMAGTAMTQASTARLGDTRQHYLSAEIDGQAFGIPVLAIREVLSSRRIGRMPLAPRMSRAC